MTIKGKKELQLVRIALGLTACFVFAMSVLLEELNWMFASVLMIFVANVCYSLEDLKNRFLFFFFSITFFTFLLGQYVFGGWGETFEDNIYGHIFLCLFISQLGLLIGMDIQNWMPKKKTSKSVLYSKKNVVFLEKSAVFTACVLYVFQVIPLLEKVIFVQTHSYLEYYTSFVSEIPRVIIKLGEGFTIAFWIALACFPKAKTAVLLLLMYAFLGILSLGMGQRNVIVLNAIMIVVYLIVRDNLRVDRMKWVTAKRIFLCIPVGIIGVAFLGWFNYARMGSDGGNSVLGLFVDFFESQGGAVNVIGYGKEYEGQFPNDTNYSFGPIVSFLKQNIFTRMVATFPQYVDHTVEKALYGNSFGQTISYLVMPWNYLNGIGLGSCYIAEIYHDFKYMGVLVYNVLLGVLLRQFTKNLQARNPIIMAFYFVAIRQILYLPRDAATVFITTAFNIISILLVAVILAGAEVLRVGCGGKWIEKLQMEVASIGNIERD